MIKVIKEEIEIEESLKQRILIICDFCNTTPTILNGSIRRIDKTNFTYLDPYKIIINDIAFLTFNYSDEMFFENLNSTSKWNLLLQVSDMEL